MIAGEIPMYDVNLVPLIEFWNAWYVTILASIGVCAFIICWDYLSPLAAKRREEEMSRKQRKQVVKSMLSDGILDMLDKMFEEQKISIVEYNEWIINFGTRSGLTDLLPRYKDKHPDKEDLKKVLRQRTHVTRVFGDLKIALRKK